MMERAEWERNVVVFFMFSFNATAFVFVAGAVAQTQKGLFSSRAQAR